MWQKQGRVKRFEYCEFILPLLLQWGKHFQSPPLPKRNNSTREKIWGPTSFNTNIFLIFLSYTSSFTVNFTLLYLTTTQTQLCCHLKVGKMLSLLSFISFFSLLWWQKKSELILYPFNVVPGKNGLVWIEPLFSSCSVLLDGSTGLSDAGSRATLVALGSAPSFQLSGISPFSPSLSDLCCRHVHGLYKHGAFTLNAKSSHTFTDVPSLFSLMLTDGTSSSSQTHFNFTQQGRAAEKSHCWWAERERASCLSALHPRLRGSEVLSGIAMATFCTLVNSRGTLKLFLS